MASVINALILQKIAVSVMQMIQQLVYNAKAEITYLRVITNVKHANLNVPNAIVKQFALNALMVFSWNLLIVNRLDNVQHVMINV